MATPAHAKFHMVKKMNCLNSPSRAQMRELRETELMRNKADVSIIMCAYNEGGVIEETIGKVDSVMMKTDWSYEIIVVDDGSLDNTWKKAFDYTDDGNKGHVKVVGYRRNTGKGKALKTGFAYAHGKFVVIMDGDLDINPELVPRYLEALKNNDIAVASKRHAQSNTMMSWKRKFLSCGFNALARLLTGVKLKDTQTGLKAFRRNVLEKISSKLVVNRYAFDLELLAACNHCGFEIVELPVDVRIRGMIDFKEILRMAVDLLKIARRLRILKNYQRS